MLEHLGLSHSQPDRFKVPRRQKDFRSGTNSLQKQGFSWSVPEYNTYKHKVFRHWAKYLSQQWPILAMWKEKIGTWKVYPTILSQLPAMKVAGRSEPRDCIWALIFNRLCQISPPWTCLSLNSFTVLTSTTSCCNGFHNLIIHCVKKYFLCLC